MKKLIELVFDTCAIIDLLEDNNTRSELMMALMDDRITIAAPTILELTSYAKPGEQMEARITFLDELDYSNNVIVPDIEHYEAAGRWLRGVKAAKKTEKEDWKMDSLIAATVWMQEMALVGKDKDFKTLREQGGMELEKEPQILPPGDAMDIIMGRSRFYDL